MAFIENEATKRRLGNHAIRYIIESACHDRDRREEIMSEMNRHFSNNPRPLNWQQIEQGMWFAIQFPHGDGENEDLNGHSIFRTREDVEKGAIPVPYLREKALTLEIFMHEKKMEQHSEDDDPEKNERLERVAQGMDHEQEKKQQEEKKEKQEQEKKMQETQEKQMQEKQKQEKQEQEKKQHIEHQIGEKGDDGEGHAHAEAETPPPCKYDPQTNEKARLLENSKKKVVWKKCKNDDCKFEGYVPEKKMKCKTCGDNNRIGTLMICKEMQEEYQIEQVDVAKPREEKLLNYSAMQAISPPLPLVQAIPFAMAAVKGDAQHVQKKPAPGPQKVSNKRCRACGELQNVARAQKRCGMCGADKALESTNTKKAKVEPVAGD